MGEEGEVRAALIFDFLYGLDDLMARVILDNGGQRLTPREKAKLRRYLDDVLESA